MIVVTGAVGFIGSCLVGKLNDERIGEIMVVDDFADRGKKRFNLEGKVFSSSIYRGKFFDWLAVYHEKVGGIFHMGARTDTAESDKRIFDRLNWEYSKRMWTACSTHRIPLVYASSAATYGAGEHGYDDSHDLVNKLRPLNLYGESKNDFDKWALRQEARGISPPSWAGLKFFNVYGPNEAHKERMASVVFHAFSQISEEGKMRLFRSHRPDFGDGEQKRDFIYVKDVLDVCAFFMEPGKPSGLYNVGTGKARTFLDLAHATFDAMGEEEDIEFIETPEDIREKYQYFTEASMQKLRSAGYQGEFHSLEQGIADYVRNYLMGGRHL